MKKLAERTIIGLVIVAIFLPMIFVPSSSSAAPQSSAAHQTDAEKIQAARDYTTEIYAYLKGDAAQYFFKSLLSGFNHAAQAGDPDGSGQFERCGTLITLGLNDVCIGYEKGYEVLKKKYPDFLEYSGYTNLSTRVLMGRDDAPEHEIRRDNNTQMTGAIRALAENQLYQFFQKNNSLVGVSSYNEIISSCLDPKLPIDNETKARDVAACMAKGVQEFLNANRDVWNNIYYKFGDYIQNVYMEVDSFNVQDWIYPEIIAKSSPPLKYYPQATKDWTSVDSYKKWIDKNGGARVSTLLDSVRMIIADWLLRHLEKYDPTAEELATKSGKNISGYDDAKNEPGFIKEENETGDLITERIEAAGGQVTQGEGCSTSALRDPITWAICKVLIIPGAIANTFLGWVFNGIKKVLEVVEIDENSSIYAGWEYSRAIANALFIFIFLIIALFNTLRIQMEQYQVRRMIPTLVFAIIFVNFSMTVGLFVLNFANALQKYASSLGTAHFADQTQSNLSKTVLLDIGKSGSIGANIIKLLFGYVVILIGLYLYIVLWVRVILINILFMVAPIAAFAMVLPWTKKYFSQWWTTFFQWVFMGPVVAFLLGLTVISMAGITGIHQLQPGTLESLSGPVILNSLITAAIMYIAATYPLKMGGALMGAASGVVGKQYWGRVKAPLMRRYKARAGAVKAHYGLMKGAGVKKLEARGKEIAGKAEGVTRGGVLGWAEKAWLRGGGISGRAARAWTKEERLEAVASAYELGEKLARERIAEDTAKEIFGAEKWQHDEFAQKIIASLNNKMSENLAKSMEPPEQYAKEQYADILTKMGVRSWRNLPASLRNKLKEGAGAMVGVLRRMRGTTGDSKGEIQEAALKSKFEVNQGLKKIGRAELKFGTEGTQAHKELEEIWNFDQNKFQEGKGRLDLAEWQGKFGVDLRFLGQWPTNGYEFNDRINAMAKKGIAPNPDDPTHKNNPFIRDWGSLKTAEGGGAAAVGGGPDGGPGRGSGRPGGPSPLRPAPTVPPSPSFPPPSGAAAAPHHLGPSSLRAERFEAEIAAMGEPETGELGYRPPSSPRTPSATPPSSPSSPPSSGPPPLRAEGPEIVTEENE